MSDNAPPTRGQLLETAAMMRAAIEITKQLGPAMTAIYPELSEQRRAWEASIDAIARFEALANALEANRGEPVTGALARELLECNNILGDTNAIQQEFTMPARETIETQLRPAIRERFESGSPEREMFEQKFDAIGRW